MAKCNFEMINAPRIDDLHSNEPILSGRSLTTYVRNARLLGDLWRVNSSKGNRNRGNSVEFCRVTRWFYVIRDLNSPIENTLVEIQRNDIKIRIIRCSIFGGITLLYCCWCKGNKPGISKPLSLNFVSNEICRNLKKITVYILEAWFVWTLHQQNYTYAIGNITNETHFH